MAPIAVVRVAPGHSVPAVPDPTDLFLLELHADANVQHPKKGGFRTFYY